MQLRGVVLALVLVACGSKDKDKPNPPPPAEQPAAPASAPAAAAPAPADEAHLAANAPKDQVKSVTSDRAAKIAELTAQAKKSWPDAKARYLKGLPNGEMLFVTADLADGPRHESAFVQVKSIANGKITGAIANDLVQVRTYKNGDPYSLDEADIVDWLISKPDGTEEGNLVGKYLDTQQ